MLSKIRLAFLLTSSLILTACQVFSTPVNPTITPTPVNYDLPPDTSTPPDATRTPVPSLTATIIPPSQTATLASTISPTQTTIPINVQLSIFDSLWTIVNETYVYTDFNGLDWNAIHEEYQQIITSGLTNTRFYLTMSELIDQLGDEHSYFIDPQQVSEQIAEYEGEHDYVGIGIMISAVPERQRAVILSVFPGSPAEAIGLQPRDSIISVDGIPILNEDGYLQDIVRGPEGTKVNLWVQTPGQDPRELQLTRSRITGDYSIAHEILINPEGKRIGYIFLLTFMDGTVDEQVAQALEEMSAYAPLDGLILDNRMNEGGSSLVFEPILSYFISGNLGYFIRHSEEYPLMVKLHDIHGSSQLPLVILVGPGTTSFGEIFSGILQDTGRAYLMGTTTQGNVEVLWGYDFEDGSQLWLANETFRPLNHSGQDWEASGIIPDMVVQGEFDQYSLENDPAVLAAIQYLSGQ